MQAALGPGAARPHACASAHHAPSPRPATAQRLWPAHGSTRGSFGGRFWRSGAGPRSLTVPVKMPVKLRVKLPVMLPLACSCTLHQRAVPRRGRLAPVGAFHAPVSASKFQSQGRVDRQLGRQPAPQPRGRRPRPAARRLSAVGPDQVLHVGSYRALCSRFSTSPAS